MSMHIKCSRDGSDISEPPRVQKDPYEDRCMYCAEEAIGITDSGTQSCGHPTCGVVVKFFKKEPTEE